MKAEIAAGGSASSVARGVCGAAVALLGFLAQPCQAAPASLMAQVLTLPPHAGVPHYADVDGDGRWEVFAMDPVRKGVLHFHHGARGLRNSPDQFIPLPPHTAWVTLADVADAPGLELVISTARGIQAARQTNGLFETEAYTLIEAGQVFTNSDSPFFLTLWTNDSGGPVLPVITADEAVFYERSASYEWKPAPAVPIETLHSSWNRLPAYWALGEQTAQALHTTLSRRTGTPVADSEDEPGGNGNESARSIVFELAKQIGARTLASDRIDIDNDGRQDLVAWQIIERLDLKTDVYIFKRGVDDRLPDRPTQVLHCNGIPIPIHSTVDSSPLADIDGDGVCELVLVDLTTVLTSPGGFAEIALTRGAEWSLNIRRQTRGVFPRSIDASMPFVMLMSLAELGAWPICMPGDFNGDGRVDLAVRRTETQWNIFVSTRDRRLFVPQPAFTFEAPRRGYFEVQDLTGDGLVEIIWREREGRLSIFTPPQGRQRERTP